MYMDEGHSTAALYALNLNFVTTSICQHTHFKFESVLELLLVELEAVEIVQI